MPYLTLPGQIAHCWLSHERANTLILQACTCKVQTTTEPKRWALQIAEPHIYRQNIARYQHNLCDCKVVEKLIVTELIGYHTDKLVRSKKTTFGCLGFTNCLLLMSKFLVHECEVKYK